MAVPPAVSKDGYKIQFTMNHIAHALMIKFCLPALQKATEEKGDARIVVLSSLAFRNATGIEFKQLRTDYTDQGFVAKFKCYGQSKLANAIYASQLAKHYPNITSLALHPGLTFESNMGSHLNWINYLRIQFVTRKGTKIPLHEAAYNSLWAATSSDSKTVENGKPYEPIAKPSEGTRATMDPALGEELWSWTQKELALYS